MAALAALLIAASLIYMAWDGVRRQRDLLDRHLALTAGVVSRGVQVHLMRRLRPVMGMPDHMEPPPPPPPDEDAPGSPGRHRGMGPGGGRGQGFGAMADEIFRETVQGNNIP